MDKLITDRTESGDLYEGTQEAWNRYYSAWDDNDMELIEAMEAGHYPDFQYTGRGA